MVCVASQVAPCTPLACGHRLQGRSWPGQMMRASRMQASRQPHRKHIVRAAAAGAAPNDPYKVLGLSEGADSQAIQRQYNKLKRENKFNESTLSAIENAHSSLMMRNLTARMKGGVSVAKEVKYADKAVYFPWRPRLYRADPRTFLANSVLQAVLLTWAILGAGRSGRQEAILISFVLGTGVNIWKQSQIFPQSGGSTPSDKDKAKGTKNVLRGLLMGVFGTFGGCLLFYTFPDLISSTIKISLPAWFYRSEMLLMAIGTASCNWLMAAFYR